MTDGVEVALIVSATSLLTIGMNGLVAFLIGRTTQAKLEATHEKVIEVAHSVNGMLVAEKKAAGDLGHALGKEEGINQERDRI